ncbi:MAG: hypothetical protein DRJ03_18625 [Chloroflexi bacterium]|nr:MAG: hypothetical protein DRJ03_18625 [Chloroflexota bacterium]
MGKTKFVPQTFYPPETTTQGNVEVRFVSDERTEKEQDILVLRETITQLVELTEDFLRQLNELGYHPESQQAIIAYMTLTRAASHFKILQTEVQNFRG